MVVNMASIPEYTHGAMIKSNEREQEREKRIFFFCVWVCSAHLHMHDATGTMTRLLHSSMLNMREKSERWVTARYLTLERKSIFVCLHITNELLHTLNFFFFSFSHLRVRERERKKTCSVHMN